MVEEKTDKKEVVTITIAELELHMKFLSNFVRNYTDNTKNWLEELAKIKLLTKEDTVLVTGLQARLNDMIIDFEKGITKAEKWDLVRLEQDRLAAEREKQEWLDKVGIVALETPWTHQCLFGDTMMNYSDEYLKNTPLEKLQEGYAKSFRLYADKITEVESVDVKEKCENATCLDTSVNNREMINKKVIQLIIDEMGDETKGGLTSMFVISTLERTIKYIEKAALLRAINYLL